MSGCDGFNAASGACAVIGKGLLTLITVPAFGLLGAAIGGGVDALHSRRTLIYERPSRTSVAIAPIVSRHSTAVAFSIAW